jgi:hypothetical protein
VQVLETIFLRKKEKKKKKKDLVVDFTTLRVLEQIAFMYNRPLDKWKIGLSIQEKCCAGLGDTNFF